MSEDIYLYPVWVRIWHIVNALLCILLILTGLSMQYSDAQTGIIRFDIAVSLHNIAGIILTVNYICFIIGNILTDNGDQYKFKRENLFTNLLKQIRYYAFGIFKKETPPFPISKKNKFNPLQRFIYIVVTYFGLAILVITGWLYFFPGLIPNSIFGISGILINAMLHVSFAFIISVFMIVHIYFCTMGRTAGSNFVSMITGWHKLH